MCGILGFASQQPIGREDFGKALKTLRERGPDDEGIYEDYINDTQVLLGSRRLAVLDLSEAGHQPMMDDQGDAVITFNGEIYNYQQLREELRRRGHKFRSDTDTEVLLKGYLEYGTEIVKKLDGMFAFGIYDQREQKIFCARDHFGKKPLYFYSHETSSTFTFASELKALHKAFIKHPELSGGLTPSNLAVKQFLVYGYIPAPNSIYEGVKKLPLATALIYNLGSGKIEKIWRYWKLEEAVTKLVRGRERKMNKRMDSFGGVINELDTLLHKSVKERLISDVPLGSFLSGGVDSSLITAIASQYTSNLDTFTVAYEGDDEIDEAEFARLTSQHLDIKPHFFHFRDEDARSTLERVLDYMDEPFADAAILPLAFLSRETRKSVTVALSGDGGDELFGGYPKYKAQLLAESVPRVLVPNKILTNLLRGCGSSLSKFLQGLRYDLPVRQFYWGGGGFAPEEPWGQLFRQSHDYAELFQQNDPGNRFLFLDLMIQLPDGFLTKVDRASMSCSLEVRSPLLQKELVEKVFSLPSSYKFGLFHSKKLLKKLAAEYLPDEITYRSKKGFGVPLARWLRGVFRPKVERSFRESSGEIFEPLRARRLWKQFLGGDDRLDTKIWRLFILNEWLNRR